MWQHLERPLFGLAVLVAVLAAAPIRAEPGWTALAAPGTHALMRHALAPGTGDPDHFRLGDCSTQRNLNDVGRAQAREIGAAIRKAEIRVSRVITSQWCRAAETARLLELAPVFEEPALNSFFAHRASADQQTRLLRQLLLSATPGEKLILVTHQVNITALTGLVPGSGEVLVVAAGENGGIEVVGRIATEAR